MLLKGVFRNAWVQKQQYYIFPRQSCFSCCRPSVGQTAAMVDILMFLWDHHTVAVGACCTDTLSSCLIHFIKEVLRVFCSAVQRTLPLPQQSQRFLVCACVSVHSARAFLFFFSVFTLFYSSCENNLVMCTPSCYEIFKFCFFVRVLQCSWLALLVCLHDKWTLKILVIYNTPLHCGLMKHSDPNYVSFLLVLCLTPITFVRSLVPSILILHTSFLYL